MSDSWYYCFTRIEWIPDSNVFKSKYKAILELLKESGFPAPKQIFLSANSDDIIFRFELANNYSFYLELDPKSDSGKANLVMEKKLSDVS
jgi:hypothetical protein